MKKRILSMILAAIMLMSVLTACGTYGDQNTTGNPVNDRPKTKEGYGSVTFSYTEPNTLNLLTSQSNLDKDVFYLISVMLYRPFEDKVYPEMATGYTVSEDACTYTYSLKEAYYTDGTQIVAADFVYYILNSFTCKNSFLGSIKNGKKFMAGECEASEVGVYAKDDLTLVVELEEPSAEFVPEMQIYPLKQSYAESKGDALGGTPNDFLCSGPYVLTEWVYGASLSFEKNPNYLDAENSFQIAKLKMIHGADENAKYNMFIGGEVDVLLSVGAETQSRLAEYAGKKYMTGAIQGLEFNTTGFYFDGTTFAQKNPAVAALLANKNFRMALCYALNREAIVNVVDEKSAATNRYFDTAAGTEAGKTFADQNPIEVAPVAGDEALAKQYLATALQELGYSSVSELPTIKYLTFENANFRLMAETIQSEWKRVLGLENIEIELKPIQDAIMSMVYMNYDIYYQATSVEPQNPYASMNYWVTGGALSDVMQAGAPFSSIHSNADFDAKVAQAKITMDTAARNVLLAEAEEMFLQSYLFIPILNQGSYYVVNSRVQGFVYADAVPGFMFNNAYVVE